MHQAAKAVQCSLEYTTLRKVTQATEIWYDPDPRVSRSGPPALCRFLHDSPPPHQRRGVSQSRTLERVP